MPRRRSDEDEEKKPEAPIEVVIDTTTEIIVLAAAMVDPGHRAWLATQLRVEQFLDDVHRALWGVVLEIERRKLDFDPALVKQFAGDRVPDGYVEKVLGIRPEPPDRPNLEHYVETIRRDFQKATAIKGPLASLIDALRRPNEPWERVRALADHVSQSFAGAGSSYITPTAALVEKQSADLRERIEGRACFGYGIPGLDFYERGYVDGQGREMGGRSRIIPGTKPGQLTTLSGFSSGGKSTMAANMALGMARGYEDREVPGRKVLYCAWEPGGGMTLELMAIMSLGWSRTDVFEGHISHEDRVQLEERMHAIGQMVSFMENPFGRKVGARPPTNEGNLAILQQHIVDSGCDVWIVDLWDRCCVKDDPSEEKQALWRTHGIAEETRTHGILLAQQLMKGEGVRADRQPRAEGTKGSSAWYDVTDTFISPHRPAQGKRVLDNKMWALIFKMRWGFAPQCVEFDYDAEFGVLSGGLTIPYDPFEGGGGGGALDDFKPPDISGGGGGKRRRR